MLVNRLPWKERGLSYFLLSVVLLYMLAVNFLMPLMADDYRYSLQWATNERIAGFSQIVAFEITHYFEWGGRIVAQSLAQVFLYLGKDVFNLFNSLMFVVLILLIYWHAQAEISMRLQPALLSVILLFVWFCVPHFGETVIWLTGSCNYLWTTVLVFSFLLPYQLKLAGRRSSTTWKLPAAFGMFAFGVIAGWTNENTGFTLLLAACLSTLYFWRAKCLELWNISGICGALAGYVIMVAAPGNYIRVATFTAKANYSFFEYHIVDGMSTMARILFLQLPLFLLLGYALKKLLQSNSLKRSINLLSEGNNPLTICVYCTAFSILCNLVVLGSPHFPLRAGFASSIFLMIGVMSLFRLQVMKSIMQRRESKIFIITCLCLFLIPTAFLTLKKYQIINLDNQQRLVQIESSRAGGIKDVQVKPFSVSDRSILGHVIVNDLGQDPNSFRNQYYARFFGLEKLSLQK